MILQKLRIPQHSNDGSTQGETSSRSQKDVDTSHYNYFDSVQTPIDRVHESTSYVDPSYTAIDQSKNNSPLSPIITPQLDSRIASTDCGSRHNSNFCIILPPDSAHFPHPGDRVSSVASPKRTHVVFWPKKERNLSIGDSQMDIQTTERETHTGEAIDTSLAATRAFCWAVEFVLCVVVITLLARSLHLTQETYIPYERLPAVMALIAGVIGSIAATLFFFIQPSFFTGSALEKLYLFRRFLEATMSPLLLILWVGVTCHFKKMDGLPIRISHMNCSDSGSSLASLCEMQTGAFFGMIAICIISFIIVVTDAALWNRRRTRK